MGALLSLQFHKQAGRAAHKPELSPKSCRAYCGQKQVETPLSATNYECAHVFCTRVLLALKLTLQMLMAGVKGREATLTPGTRG